MRNTMMGVMIGSLALCGAAQAQFDDDFESYTLGDIVGQGGWESWDDDPGAAGSQVVDTIANGGAQSVAVSGQDDLVHQFTGYTSGVWVMTCYQYIPGDMTGQTFFILLNTYAVGGPNNWSTQVSMTTDLVEDADGGGGAVPTATDEWAEIKIVLNFDADEQTFFYNGALVRQGSWTEGASGGGVLNLGAIDLWSNGASVHYYDDLTIEVGSSDGACCFSDGTCTGPVSSADCDTAGGTFQGSSTECAAADCPELTPDGWLRTAPFSWQGDTCTETDDCGLKAGNDIAWVVTIPWDAKWTFSVCGASWDTYLAIGSAPCTQDVAFNDDRCGAASEITNLQLSAGTYYLTLEGFGGPDCGDYLLQVTSGACLVTPPDGALDEGEICLDGATDTTNGGCNSTPAVFTDIECGETFYGKGWSDTTTRDTDWYEVVLTETTTVTWSGEAEFGNAVYGLVDTGGSGNCADATALTPFDQVNEVACLDASASFTTELDAGTYWFFVGANLGSTVDCVPQLGSRYYATLTCETGGTPCDGDIDESGDVGFDDLLSVLSTWGPCPGCPEDLDGNDDVGFSDLLIVLGNWGPCP